jgi:spermidine synthase
MGPRHIPKTQDPTPSTRDVRLGEDDGRPVLLVDGTVQSVLADDPGGYWSLMVPDVRPSRALLLGLGAGTIARLLADRFGDLPMVGIDEDSDVIGFAQELLRDVPGLEIVQADAFAFVAEAAIHRDHFDFAAIDLYRGDQMVHGVLGRPFLRGLRALLEPRGLAVFNLFDERRVDDRVRRIGRVFDILDRRIAGKNLVLWCRA